MADLISRAAAVRALASSNGDYLDALERIEKIHAVEAAPVVRCKDCKHFEVKDVWANFGSVPILVSDVPTCHRWEGECKTSPDGFCFLGERRESE